MKKINRLFYALAIAVAFLGGKPAQAMPNCALQIYQVDSGGEFFWGRWYDLGCSAPSFLLAQDGATQQPVAAQLASSLTLSGGVLSVTLGSGDVTTALGYTPYSNANPSGFITTSALSGYATTSALTSGLAGKFNNPSGTTAQYIRGDGSTATFPSVGVTSVGITSTSLSISGSPVTSSGNITVNLPTRTVNFPTKTLNTCFQLSTTRDYQVTYNAEIVSTLALVGGQQGTLYLETFTDSGCTTGTQEIMRSTNGNTSALIVAVGNVATSTLTVSGPVLANTWAKLRTQNNTGTPAFTARPGSEYTLN